MVKYAKEQSFSATKKLQPELAGVNFFVTAGIGEGFKRFLANQDIECIVVSDEVTPEDAVHQIIQTL